MQVTAAVIALLGLVAAAVYYLLKINKTSFSAGAQSATDAQQKAALDAIDAANRARRDAGKLPDNPDDYRD